MAADPHLWRRDPREFDAVNHIGAVTFRLSDWLRMLGGKIGRPVPRWKVPYPLAMSLTWYLEPGWI